MEKKYRIHPGWLVAFACLLMNATLFVSLISLPGLFTVSVSESLGFQRSTFSLHMTLCTLTSMVSTLFVGRVFQKKNPKYLTAIAAAMVALCFLAKAYSTQLWQFYLTSILSGFFGAYTGLVVVSMLINSWFGPKLRGKVMGIVQAGSGIGTAILSTWVSSVIQTKGWEAGYFLLGVILLVVSPVLLLCIRKSPEELGLSRLGEAEVVSGQPGSTDGIPASKALGTVTFWLMICSFFITSAVGVFYSSNVQGHLISLGQSVTMAGTLISIGSLVNMGGKIALGSAADKWGIRRSASVALIVLLAGAALLGLSVKIPGLAIVGIVLFSLGNCVPTVGTPLVILEHFGSKDYGTIMGFNNVGTSLGAALAPTVGALVYDVTGSYLMGWISVCILLVVSLCTLNISYTAKSKMNTKI